MGEATQATPDRAGAAVRRVRRLHGGRHRRLVVRVSDAELSEVSARAAAAGKSPQLFLLDLALGDPAKVAERRAAHASFLEVRRTLIGLATNVNQLAKAANTDGRLPVGTADALASIEAMRSSVDSAVALVAARVGSSG